jgi:hypothetical protein
VKLPLSRSAVGESTVRVKAAPVAKSPPASAEDNEALALGDYGLMDPSTEFFNGSSSEAATPSSQEAVVGNGVPLAALCALQADDS